MRNLSLDFYRGFFAIIVVIGHFFYWQGLGAFFPLSFTLSVDFFFILSGYVLTYPILSSQFNTNQYTIYLIKKRIFRLFPLYLFLAIPLTIFVWLFIPNNTPNGFDWLRIIGLLQVFPFDTKSALNYPLDVAWSISSEFWIGIVYFPVIFLARKNTIVIPVLGLASIFTLLIINKESPDFMNVHYQQYNSYMTYANSKMLIRINAR